MSELVQNKEFDDLTFYKLLFSVGGGSYSTREGALFNVIKVSITDFTKSRSSFCISSTNSDF